MTTADQIDARIAAWTERLQRIDDSLLALEGEPIYQMLAPAAGKRAPLDGVTRERVAPALDALANLFECRQRLGEVFERAKELRASMSALAFWENDDKLREIQKLLDGPSIHMGTQATPLAQRRLLDAGAHDVLLSPEQVLAAMAMAFEGARDALLAVGEAWKTLEPALERMEREAQDLRALAESLGELEAVRGDLATIGRELEAARTRLARDPLGATGSVEGALAPRIAEIRARVSAISVQRERATRGLARASERRRALGELHKKARAARASAMTTFAGARIPDVIAEDQLDGLDAWREKLEATCAARRWSSAAVGVERWLEACDGYARADEAVLTAAEGLFAHKREVEGRFSARKAQLAALAARGATPTAQAEDLARVVERALATRPFDPSAADAALQAFEAAVISAARK